MLTFHTFSYKSWAGYAKIGRRNKTLSSFFELLPLGAARADHNPISSIVIYLTPVLCMLSLSAVKNNKKTKHLVAFLKLTKSILHFLPRSPLRLLSEL